MERALPSLFVIALIGGGCAEAELDRAPTGPADTVQLSNREPGSACRPLECVEVRSGRDDEPSSEVLRSYAADRGANYVVIDTFSVLDERTDEAVLTRARLFRCPALAPSAQYD